MKYSTLTFLLTYLPASLQRKSSYETTVKDIIIISAVTARCLVTVRYVALTYLLIYLTLQCMKLNSASHTDR